MRGRVKAHDPFELIRWLAMSQPDPRKALAELVQNSLDAGAKTIRVTRVREKGHPCLRVFDDGAGVIPELDRREALKYIATHIGHSRKRNLSPEERLQMMTQGQYGIGLLGFWCLGAVLEMRSSVPGQRPYRLTLYRNKPDFLIEPLRGRLSLDGRWTEVVVVGLSREASAALHGRRAADWLASELRGQLLARETSLVIEDRMSRGTAQKQIAVRPQRFLGEPLPGMAIVTVAGHAPARMELYLVSDPAPTTAARGPSVYAAGTLVAESFHDLAPLGLDRRPWTDPRLAGIVDFPGFHVAPGSRRGVVADEAASGFAAAMTTVEPALNALLESLDRRRAEEIDRVLLRDLRRAFRDFYRERPRYSMLPVRSEPGRADATAEAEGPAGDGVAVGLGEDEIDGRAGVVVREPSPSRSKIGELLPPGPLDQVRIVPSPLRVLCGGRRRVRAHALDAAEQEIVVGADFAWSVDGSVGEIAVDAALSSNAMFSARAEPGEGRIRVVARAGGREASADVDVEVLDQMAARGEDEGIPDPELTHEPGASWRSRLEAGRWQVNTAHRDYRAVEGATGLKLRYLAMLFAKEIVLQSTLDPRLETPLEQLVEVASFADRRLFRRGGSGRQEA